MVMPYLEGGAPQRSTLVQFPFLLPPLPWCSPSLGNDTDVPFKAEHSTAAHSQDSDDLQVSTVTATLHKKKLLRLEMMATLIYGQKHKY